MSTGTEDTPQVGHLFRKLGSEGGGANANRIPLRDRKKALENKNDDKERGRPGPDAAHFVLELNGNVVRDCKRGVTFQKRESNNRPLQTGKEDKRVEPHVGRGGKLTSLDCGVKKEDENEAEKKNESLNMTPTARQYGYRF